MHLDPLLLIGVSISHPFESIVYLSAKATRLDLPRIFSVIATISWMVSRGSTLVLVNSSKSIFPLTRRANASIKVPRVGAEFERVKFEASFSSRGGAGSGTGSGAGAGIGAPGCENTNGAKARRRTEGRILEEISYTRVT